ncbi:MAG: 4Fe-4S binding protein [Bacteroidales bacterium]|jgi:Na+-translocating ferredoxin:NAD+ oxidoreductase RNF subunit RnfB|nr:4Fe-4S binding protein [Bacteroidales bacterium]MDD2570257.1 [Fe-Fe] hydrogenase large subunit C-terminal domain-containing protein [Bacteroidales bacterium]MDD2811833.1 [Fe-Fe] hydrogenase large subunit C-terminal domain-containing protein [Bacteroidales bacterium]MDD3384349.1 [Fe-Fe] hydrogenase large subunit C-terminal domain-containing protein [Bacteroidales bacterium]MDD3810724.1 [Fe-Fe] hydrogenase large subunit C-terminal domain-containing protein [Bacteroidales bacterium]
MKDQQIRKQSNPDPVIRVEPSECKLCYACVRECPVKAIEVKANVDHVRIIPERCIACGSCYTACPTHAIRIRSHLEKVKGYLESEEATMAIIDPSISGEFPDITDYRNFVGMIRTLGFDGVYDLSFGVELAAGQHVEIMSNFKGKYRISSKCPAVIAFIEKYYPQHTENLIPVLTPAGVTAKIIHSLHPNGCRIVLVNPCLASHLDIETLPEDSTIDAVINFNELRELFKYKKLNESMVEFSEFDPPAGRTGTLFPLTRGFLGPAGLDENLISGRCLSTDGRQNMLEAMDEFASSYDIRKHLDLFYCEGCIMGPGMSAGGHKFRRNTLVTEYARKRSQLYGEEDWEKALAPYKNLAIERTFKPDNQVLPIPDEAEIKDILNLIGKSGDDRIDRGCMACGYKSCREFAIAVAQGLAKTEMCHLYGTKNRQEYIRSLRSANEQLAKTQKALQESEKQTREEKEMAHEFSETLAAVIQKIPSGVIIVNDQHRIIQANRTFIDLFGDEIAAINEVIPGLKGADIRSLVPAPMSTLITFTLQNDQEVTHRDIRFDDRIFNISVFPVKKNSIVGIIVRDLSSPEVQREEVIKRVTEVIDKNLEMVQKIGFLLGEGASETERMLNSIIEYYHSGEK